jgi:hypothetical protein
MKLPKYLVLVLEEYHVEVGKLISRLLGLGLLDRQSMTAPKRKADWPAYKKYFMRNVTTWV